MRIITDRKGVIRPIFWLVVATFAIVFGVVHPEDGPLWWLAVAAVAIVAIVCLGELVQLFLRRRRDRHNDSVN